MSDIYGLPVITSPNLPEGTALVVNPDFILPHFEIGPISGPFITEKDIHFTWKPLSQLANDMVDSTLYAFAEPVKYRGLARVVHMVRRAWRKLR